MCVCVFFFIKHPKYVMHELFLVCSRSSTTVLVLALCFRNSGVYVRRHDERSAACTTQKHRQRDLVDRKKIRNRPDSYGQILVEKETGGCTMLDWFDDIICEKQIKKKKHCNPCSQ